MTNSKPHPPVRSAGATSSNANNTQEPGAGAPPPREQKNATQSRREHPSADRAHPSRPPSSRTFCVNGSRTSRSADGRFAGCLASSAPEAEARRNDVGRRVTIEHVPSPRRVTTVGLAASRAPEVETRPAGRVTSEIRCVMSRLDHVARPQ